MLTPPTPSSSAYPKPHLIGSNYAITCFLNKLIVTDLDNRLQLDHMS